MRCYSRLEKRRSALWKTWLPSGPASLGVSCVQGYVVIFRSGFPCTCVQVIASLLHRRPSIVLRYPPMTQFSRDACLLPMSTSQCLLAVHVPLTVDTTLHIHIWPYCVADPGFSLLILGILDLHRLSNALY